MLKMITVNELINHLSDFGNACEVVIEDEDGYVYDIERIYWDADAKVVVLGAEIVG